MKASLSQREPKWLAQWQEDGLYQQIRNARRGAEKFILHDGPPYANGDIHCGHALNKVLKDIIIKAKTLSGYDAPFVPGWDCHGLPIELKVEKKVGKPGGKVTSRAFRSHCRSYAQTQWQGQRTTFERLGVLGDWQQPYLTMNYAYEADTLRALASLFERGQVYQTAKPVLWCLDCASAMAEAEVEYQDKTSTAIDVAFSIVSQQSLPFASMLKDDKALAIPIWTTTPWTLPANQAVAMHGDIDYVLVETAASHLYHFICAQTLVTAFCQRCGIEDYRVACSLTASDLDGVLLDHPMFDGLTVPVILSGHVTDEAGTGSVHIAPSHGPEDFYAAQRYGISVSNPTLDNGCYRASLPVVGGKHIREAEPLILEQLARMGTLLSKNSVSHSYPHCWRHKTPVIYRATPQWFIAMDTGELRTTASTLTNAIRFIPPWGKARMQDMIEKRPDWCISRQRTWGVPIAVFVHVETGEPHPNTVGIMREVAEIVQEQGVDAWFDLDPKALLGDDAATYRKVTDVLDVWFDSGVSHYCVLSRHQDLRFPADLYLEGSDQHRGWFNSSLTTASAIAGQPPYHTVLTHGFTVDGDGKKMSKSLGNFIAPEHVLRQYGADVLRLWVASVDYHAEVHLSEDILKRAADTYRRIRNTCRYLLASLFDFNYDTDALPTAQWLSLDRWAVELTAKTQQQLLEAYEKYDFHRVYQLLHHFCSVDMSSFYLDIIKDRQYTTPTASIARRSCQTAMWYVLQALVRWMTPILSFTAQEVWSSMQYPDYVFLTQWFTHFPDLEQQDMVSWQRIRECREHINKQLERARREGCIGSSLEAEVMIFAEGEDYRALTALGHELRFVLITSAASVSPYLQKNSSALDTDRQSLACKVVASAAPKCERCWHRCISIGHNVKHPTLCQRCIGNISGQDEQRQYA